MGFAANSEIINPKWFVGEVYVLTRGEGGRQVSGSGLGTAVREGVRTVRMGVAVEVIQ